MAGDTGHFTKLAEGGVEGEALPGGGMEPASNPADLIERLFGDGRDAFQGDFGGGGRIGDVVPDDLRLKADSRQHLSNTGVQFPAKALAIEFDLALAIEFDLAYGVAAGGGDPSAGRTSEFALGRAKPLDACEAGVFQFIQG